MSFSPGIRKQGFSVKKQIHIRAFQMIPLKKVPDISGELSGCRLIVITDQYTHKSYLLYILYKMFLVPGRPVARYEQFNKLSGERKVGRTAQA